MASYVGAELIQCETGSPISRIQSGRNRDFGERPVIVEGGVPLAEGAVVKILGRCGPLIALGADSTYHDLINPMPSRTRTSRLAHRISQRFIDGTLAVSERIATIAEQYTSGPVRVTHPFVKSDRYDRLKSIDPSLDTTRILCVGKYREKNGQDRLIEALSLTETETTVDFVGPDTEEIEETEQIKTYGFVTEDRLIELFESASLLVFPASVGAFPVATLEGFCAGLPVLTTHTVGTATLARGVSGRLVVNPTPAALAQGIDWYFGLPVARREELGRRAHNYGSGFDEPSRLEAFAFELRNLLEDIEYEVTIVND